MLESSGMNFDECNATLKHYGVVEAYQQDGGGSVTAIIRDNYGGFTITSSSSDSPSSTAQRSIYEGCFFVVRDPEYRCYGMDSTPSSLTIKRVSSLNKDIISNIKATVNGFLIISLYSFFFKKDTIMFIISRYGIKRN